MVPACNGYQTLIGESVRACLSRLLRWERRVMLFKPGKQEEGKKIPALYTVRTAVQTIRWLILSFESWEAILWSYSLMPKLSIIYLLLLVLFPSLSPRFKRVCNLTSNGVISPPQSLRLVKPFGNCLVTFGVPRLEVFVKSGDHIEADRYIDQSVFLLLISSSHLIGNWPWLMTNLNQLPA